MHAQYWLSRPIPTLSHKAYKEPALHATVFQGQELQSIDGSEIEPIPITRNREVDFLWHVNARFSLVSKPEWH